MMDESAEDPDTQEPDCSSHAADLHAIDVDADTELSENDADAVAELPDGENTIVDQIFGAVGLGPKGGAWGGAQAPVNRAQAIGVANRLTVTSRKRSTGSTGSDHHTSQRASDAVDLSNGSSPTPQMDRTATQIAALLGVPGWRGGVLNRTMNGYRVQLLYRTNVGGNHYNHVHVGVRVL